MRITTALLAALLLSGLLVACDGGTGDTPNEAASDAGTANESSAAVDVQEPADDTAGDGEAASDDLEARVDLGDDAEVTESGLQILDVAVGEGPAAERCDTVTVHYTGTLASGDQFDGSVERGEPLQFTLGSGEVIKGWDEGLVGMQVGGQRTLAIPPELAYGDSAKGDIPANSQLIFDVEMVGLSQRPQLPEAPADVEDYETTGSGLQYTVLEAAEGEEAGVGDEVLVHYSGWLEDGTLFDSSLNPDRCEPFVFRLGQGMVIPGWDEGVVGMMVGEQRQLVIPPELGYGASGYGPIPADSTLVFEVELVGIR